MYIAPWLAFVLIFLAAFFGAKFFGAGLGVALLVGLVGLLGSAALAFASSGRRR